MSKKLTKQNLRERFCEWLVSGEGKEVDVKDYRKISDFFYSQIGQEEECCEKCKDNSQIIVPNDSIRYRCICTCHQTERKDPVWNEENGRNRPTTFEEIEGSKPQRKVPEKIETTINGWWKSNTELAKLSVTKINEIITFLTPPRGEEEKKPIYVTPQEAQRIKMGEGIAIPVSSPQPRESWEEQVDEITETMNGVKVVEAKLVKELLASEKERIAERVTTKLNTALATTRTGEGINIYYDIINLIKQ